MIRYLPPLRIAALVTGLRAPALLAVAWRYRAWLDGRASADRWLGMHAGVTLVLAQQIRERPGTVLAGALALVALIPSTVYWWMRG